MKIYLLFFPVKIFFTVAYVKVKGKGNGKVCPRTGRENPEEGVEVYSTFL
jgi:hypothetical protein